MADMDGKRYYWLKLRKDFFQQHQMKVLKSLPNGRVYALIYLELLAESTSHEGKLRFSEMLPYDVVTLAAVIDEDKDILEAAITNLERLGMLEILDDQTIFLTDIQTMIGSESGQTMRKNLAKAVKSTKDLPDIYQKNTLENRDKSIEIRDKSIDIREKKEKIRHKHGEYSNVLLTDEEFEKLKREFPDWESRIERLSSYMKSTGKSYKDHLATIRNWARREKPAKKVEELPKYEDFVEM